MVLSAYQGGSGRMEFTTDMFIDLAYKSAFLLAYGVAIVVVWSLGETVVKNLRRGR
jgi:hypothetical protein